MVTYLKRFTMFSLLILIAHFSMAYQPPPRVTISMKNATMQQVFDEINKQTGLIVFYSSAHLNAREKISLQFTNEQLDKVMNLILKDKPLTYEIDQKFILIRAKPDKPVADSQKAFSLPPAPLVENAPVMEAIPPIEIRGRVLDESGQPVAGASVLVKGTTNGTSTDANGYFTLTNVDEKATLLITSVNIEPIEVKVNGRSSITVSAKTAVKEEEIVVAYGTRTRTNNVAAVTVVKGEQIQSLPNRSFEKSLQGLVPGLLVNSGTGQPGAATNNFVLRGIATGGIPTNGQSFRNPLVVVDGVPVHQDPLNSTSTDVVPESNPMAQLNPSDIESVSILKDAAAVALYGSKASNGVILVTTKKGKAGKTIFSFRHQTDLSQRMKDPEVLNQEEYMELLLEAYRNTQFFPDDAAIFADIYNIFPYKVSNGDTSFYPMPDWNAEFFNKSAITLSNELSMSGGNDHSNFYLNLEYTKQDGVIKETGFDRKSIRFNYENKVAPWLKLGINTTASYTTQGYSAGSGNILTVSPLLPIRLSGEKYIDNYMWGLGSFDAYVANPILASKLNISSNTAYRGLTKLYGELKFLKYFMLSSTIGADFVLNENKQKNHPRFILPFETTPGIGFVRSQIIRNAILINTNIFRFDRAFSNTHSVNLLLGQEAQILTNNNSIIEQRGFALNPTATEPSGGAFVQEAIGFADKQTLLSYFGQANYGFRNTYFLSGTIRADGSSRFGSNKRFGTYWSVGGSWVVTSEPFMKKLSDWLNYMKLRGSIGSAGNSSAIRSHLRYNSVELLNYLNNPAVMPNDNAGNPDIQWENTLTWDAGFEAMFWKERISFTADLYARKTSELIAYDIIIPAATGYRRLTDNIGDLKNTGVEISFSVDVFRNKNFRWNLGANWSKNQSKLTKAYLPQIGISSYLTNQVGEEYSSFYLPRWAGVNPANGAPQWFDSTGKVSEDYYAAKREIVGKSQPDGFGAISTRFSYKGFELSAMLYYQYGFQIYLPNALQNDGLNPYLNQTRDALNRWQKPGDIALNPRRLWFGYTPTFAMDLGSERSTRYLYEGDFIRLKNVALSYDFPKKIVDRLRLSTLRIFAQGHNLATWTKYSGQDPENTSALGVGNFLYPQQRSYSLGLNLSF